MADFDEGSNDPNLPNDSISENFVSPPAPAFEVRPLEKHLADTRRWLAFVLVGLVGLFDAALIVAFLAHWISLDDLVRAVAAFSGLQALGAVAVGYFFAKER